jgi:hypothetical protein
MQSLHDGVLWRAASLLMLGWLAVFFGRTLAPGQTPLIERIARLSDPAMTAPLRRYTRLLTAIWCGYFVIAALVSACLAHAFPGIGLLVLLGSAILFVAGAANRDDRVYPDPDRFDVERPLKLNVGFGHGIHTCLGAALARLESRIAFDEIATRWPEYDVDETQCRRVNMSNVAGYSSVPVRVPARA